MEVDEFKAALSLKAHEQPHATLPDSLGGS